VTSVDVHNETYITPGTSPLYVLNGIWPSSGPVPSQENIIGGVSAIVWSMTLVPLLKYVRDIYSYGLAESDLADLLGSFWVTFWNSRGRGWNICSVSRDLPP
jgi:hypothetical protein